MKILHVFQNYNKEGGLERIFVELSEQLARKHEVHVLTKSWSKDAPDNIVFHKIRNIENPWFIDTLTFAMSSSKWIKLDEFDIVLNFGGGASFKQDIILSESCHRAWVEIKKQNKEYLRYILNPFHRITLLMEEQNYKLGHYRKIIACSNVVKKEIMKYYSVPENDIDVVHNGVNINEFNLRNKQRFREEIRRNFKIHSSDIILLFMGNEFRRKGLKYIIESFNFINRQNIKLLVVGKGNKEEFQPLIKNLKIDKKVIYIGHSKEVHKFFAASDLFIFPTIYESFGLVILEAMASGLPVITSRIAGAAELIKEGREGLLLEDPKNPAEIARKINLMLNGTFDIEKMGQDAKRTAEKYSWDKVSKNIEKIYGEIRAQKHEKN